MIGNSGLGMSLRKKRNMGIAGIDLRASRIEKGLCLCCRTCALQDRCARQQCRQVDGDRPFAW